MTIAARLRPSLCRSTRCIHLALLTALLAACADDAMPPTPGVDATVPPADLGVDAAVPPADLGAPDMAGPCGDADGDGARDATCGGTDCDDANPSRYPGAMEVCDAADFDEDCDSETFGFRDADGDGFPDARCCNGANCGDDCNDARPGVNPEALEMCNAVDDDCDGRTDEDLLVMLYTDADRDGFGAGTPVTGCPGMAGTVTNGDDCDDARASSNPAAMEACDGVADDDCDGTVDEGCGCVTGTTRSCGVDTGVCEVGTQECIAGAWAMCTAVVAGTESCNGLDDDCDGMTDEELLVSGCYSDSDADGFGTGAATTQCLDMSRDTLGFCPAGYTNSASPLDCNDTIAEIRPDGIERCDTLDNDCDGVVDDVIGLGDACTTGVGSCARSGTLACGGGMLVCSALAGTPGVEVCNGIDDDCDGAVDDGIALVVDCRTDADADGFGVGATTAQCFDASRIAFGGCPAGYTNTPTLDCNDINPAIRPSAPEICNLVDDDCDGVADDGVQTAYYRDVDGDFFGAGTPVFSCFAPSGGFVANDGDCNDMNRAISPAAPELCDGIDQDCDGTADDGVTINYYLDGDGDGFGFGAPRNACIAPPGYVANNADCNDRASMVRPGASELCDGVVDDDCDGVADDGCTCPAISARTVVEVGGEITGQRWSCNNIYRLTSTTFVTSGTHVIGAGTIVVGAVGSAALVITQNARIDAQGTAELPIRFSSIKEFDGDATTVPAAGDWGGVVLLGKALVNVAGGTSTIEGLPATVSGGSYGGTNDAHDCGTLRYVTIRYAGFIFGTANELNGLTVGACGTGTTLEYIETRDGLDDGIEFFGGTANLKHALVINTGDDSLDWAFGYTGKIQFFIAEQRGAAGEDRGIEADNNPDSRDATPRSAPEIWNATFVGAGRTSGGTQDGAQLREGTAGTIRNAIFMSFPDRVVRVQHSATDAQVTAGALSVRNTIFFDNARATAFECDPTSTVCPGLIAEATNRTTDPGIARGNWQPAVGSAATTGAATPPAGGFFDATATYVGAVAPTGTPWYAGWRTAD
jgi:hypothetical protein